MKYVLITCVKTYGWLVSPLLGQNCRFYPTCSRYAVEAVEQYGAFKGTYMTIRRILKCHPWYRGDMLDPVPSKNNNLEK